MTRAEKAELIQKNLLAAAVKVIGAVGYAEASIARITQEANVAQGTFYNYFASQQDIFDEVLPIVGRQLIDRIRLAVAGETNQLKRERLRFETFFRFIHETPEFYRLLTEAEVFAPVAHKRHTENMVAGYVRSFQRLKAANAPIGFEEHEFEAIAYMLIGIRHYLAMRYSYRPDSVQILPEWVTCVYVRLLSGGLFSEVPQSRQEPGAGEDALSFRPASRRLSADEGVALAETRLENLDLVAVQTTLVNVALTAARGLPEAVEATRIDDVSVRMIGEPEIGPILASARTEIARTGTRVIRIAVHNGTADGEMLALVQLTLQVRDGA